MKEKEKMTTISIPIQQCLSKDPYKRFNRQMKQIKDNIYDNTIEIDEPGFQNCYYRDPLSSTNAHLQFVFAGIKSPENKDFVNNMSYYNLLKNNF